MTDRVMEGLRPLLTPANKKALMVVVGGLLAVPVLFGVFFLGKLLWIEATKERPKFSTGTVIERSFVPAHWETEFQYRYTGQTCTYDSQTNSNRCESDYDLVPVQVHKADDWNIQIQNCAVQKKDGTFWMDKQGNNKCFSKWIDVSQTEYNRFNIGKEWLG